MKKLLLLATVSLLLLSCSSIEKDARQKIEQFISENANDASSYEFVSMDNPDTLFVADTLMLSIKKDSTKIIDFQKTEAVYSEQIKFYAAEMEKDKSLIPIYKETHDRCLVSVLYFQEKAKETTKVIDEKKSFINDLTSKPISEQIIQITFVLNFRIKNLMGGLYKTNAKIIYFPQNLTWSGVEIANPLDGLLEE
jgi:hypothetical protein